MVLTREGGSYRVLLDGRERSAVLRGKARRNEGRTVAGDRVRIDPATIASEILGIEAVEPRTSLLERRVPDGRGTRPIAANLDQVIVVMAAASPDPVLQLLDRLLLIAESNDIPARVVVNKTDLASADPVRQHLAGTGYVLLETSAQLNQGIDQFRQMLSNQESVLTGPSGAGKSTLLNALEPGLQLRTGAISARIGRGRNTTVSARLIPLGGGGFVADTPGFSDVGLWRVLPEGLALCFPDFEPWLGHCRFGDCSHRSERGCAIREAVDSGSIPASRYASYLTLYEEVRTEPQDWEK